MSPESPSAPGAPPTLLVVDDEPAIRRALQHTLEGEGYRLLAAGSGEEALELLEREPVDLLLCDLGMPGMSGLELLRRVRERWPAVIRMVLTGGGSLETAVASINQGEVHRFLTKPWSRDALLQTLRDTVEHLHALRAPAREEALARAQASLRAELAAEFPGVLEVARDDGVYLVDDDRVLRVLGALEPQGRRAFSAVQLLADVGPTQRTTLEPSAP